MPEPTKADLKAAVAKLTEQNAALCDIFAAIREGAGAHGVLPWMIGYAGGIGSEKYDRDARNLRAHARSLRRGPGCYARHDGHYCDLREGHDPARHEVHGDDGELIAAWDDPPVIADSGRTCDQANPGTGAWCHRDGDHGVHEDTDGQTWRTDGLRCECSHGQDEHDDADDSDAGRAQHECLHPGCGCGRFRRAALDEHEPTFLGGFPEDRDQPADVTA